MNGERERQKEEHHSLPLQVLRAYYIKHIYMEWVGEEKNGGRARHIHTCIHTYMPAYIHYITLPLHYRCALHTFVDSYIHLLIVRQREID